MSRAFMPHVATVTATATATVTNTAVDLHLDLIYPAPVVSTHSPLPPYPHQPTPVVSTHSPLPPYPHQPTPVVSTHSPLPPYPHQPTPVVSTHSPLPPYPHQPTPVVSTHSPLPPYPHQPTPVVSTHSPLPPYPHQPTPVVSTHSPLPPYPYQPTPVVSTHSPLPPYPHQPTPVVSTHSPLPPYPHPTLAAHKMASDTVTQSTVYSSLDTGQDSHFNTSSASMMSSAEVTAVCGIPDSRYHSGNGNWYGTTDMGDNPYWQPDLLISHGTSSEVYEQYEGGVTSCFNNTSGYSGTPSLQGDRHRHDGHWTSDLDPTCSSAYSGQYWQQEAIPQQHGGTYYSPPGNDDTFPGQVRYSEYDQGHDPDRYAMRQSLDTLCADSQNFFTSQSPGFSLSAAQQASCPQNDTFHAVNPFQEHAVCGPKWHETDIDEPQTPHTYTTATYLPAMVGSSEEQKCHRVDVQPQEARASSYQRHVPFIGKKQPKESSNEQHWGQPTCTLQTDRGVDTNCIRTTEAIGADSFHSSGMPSFCSVSSSSGNRELFNHHQQEQMEMTDSDGQSLPQSRRPQHCSSDAQSGHTQHSSADTQSGHTQHSSADTQSGHTQHSSADTQSGHTQHSLADTQSGHTQHSSADTQSGHTQHSSADTQSGHTQHSSADTQSGHTQHSLADTQSGHTQHSSADTQSGHTQHSSADTQSGHTQHSSADTQSGHTQHSSADTQSGHTQHSSADTQSGHTQHSSADTQSGCTQHFFSETRDERHQTLRSNDVSPGPLPPAISPAIHPNSQSLSGTDLPAGHTRLPVSELSGTPQHLSIPEPSGTPQHLSHADTTPLSSDLSYPSQCVKGDEISSKSSSPVSSADSSLSSLSSAAAQESPLSPPADQPLIDVDHLLSSGVTVAGFKPRPIIRKRPKVMIPTDHKDGSYWHKRKKNNDSAKRSREAKKEKEKNFYRRALELEYENYFLKERLGHVEAQLHAVTGGVPGPPPPHHPPPLPHPPHAPLPIPPYPHTPLTPLPPPPSPLLQTHSLPASHGHSGVVPGIVGAGSSGEFGGVTGGVATYAGPELGFN